MKIIRRLLEEPYRIFFPLGILLGMIGIAHWLAYGTGVLSQYSTFLHASIQIELYMSCFILGFLLTAIPRMMQANALNLFEGGIAILLLGGIGTALLLGVWPAAQLCFAGLLLFFVYFAASRALSKKPAAAPGPPPGFIWLPAAMLEGIVGSLLLALGGLGILSAWSFRLGKPLVEHGFVLSVVLGVGGFLAPRLMGTFRIPGEGLSGDEKLRVIRQSQNRERLFHLAGIAAFTASFVFEAFGSFGIAAWLRAFVVTAVLLLTRALVFKPRTQEPFVKLIWVSFWFVFLGTLLEAIFPAYRIAFRHAVFIGGYSLMIFGVAYMVIFTHAGEVERLRKPDPLLSIVFWVALLAACIRIGSVFLAEHYFILLAAASGLWLISAAAWFIRVIPFVFRFPPEGEAERLHEEAKRRVLQNIRGAKEGPCSERGGLCRP